MPPVRTPSAVARRRFRRGMMVVCALLTAAVGACGSPGEGTAAPSPGVSAPTLRAPGGDGASTDPRVEAQAKALAAYRGMWAAYQKAGQTADPDDPDLATYATEGALQTLVNGLRSVKDRGLVMKGEVVLSPRVTALEPADRPTSIEVTDCADSTNALLYRRSGELYNDEPGGRRLILATVTDTGSGMWKVTSFGVRDVGTC